MAVDPAGLPAFARCDWQAAEALLHRAAELGIGGGGVDLVTIATTMRGRATLKLGFLERGVGLLDEAMARILAASTSVRATSVMYCAAIGSCDEAHEVGRAAEWSVALDGWLSAVPSLSGVYHGNCRIYRAMLLRLRGEWTRSEVELENICGDLATDAQLIIGHAWYELGELRRLQGKASAAAAYERAVTSGHSGQPGLALLRWREGDLAAAESGIRRALAERTHTDERLAILPAATDVAIAGGELEAAERCVGRSRARWPRTRPPRCELPPTRPVVAAVRPRVGRHEGATSAADRSGDVAGARRAVRGGRRRPPPGRGKRVGDEEGASVELRACLTTFESLDARPDVDRAPRAAGRRRPCTEPARDTGALTHRRRPDERRHRREPAPQRADVHRHVGNTKLGLPSRTAAAIHAVRSGLV